MYVGCSPEHYKCGACVPAGASSPLNLSLTSVHRVFRIRYTGCVFARCQRRCEPTLVRYAYARRCQRQQFCVGWDEPRVPRRSGSADCSWSWNPLRHFKWTQLRRAKHQGDAARAWEIFALTPQRVLVTTLARTPNDLVPAQWSLFEPRLPFAINRFNFVDNIHCQQRPDHAFHITRPF